MPCHKNLDLYKLTWEEFLKNKQQEIINSFKANQMLNFGSKSEKRTKNRQEKQGNKKRNKKKKWQNIFLPSKDLKISVVIFCFDSVELWYFVSEQRKERKTNTSRNY